MKSTYFHIKILTGSSKLNIGIFLFVLFFSHRSMAEVPPSLTADSTKVCKENLTQDIETLNLAYRSIQKKIYSISDRKNEPIKLDSGREGSYPCLNYLLSLAYYANSDVISLDKMEPLGDPRSCGDFFNKLNIDCLNNCSKCTTKEAAVKQEAAKGLYHLLTENSFCSNAIETLHRKNALASRRRQSRAKVPGTLLVASGLVSIGAGVTLGLVSRFSQACLSSGNLPSSSDGKMPNCVYPDNYTIGTPILSVAGGLLTVGGAIAIYKSKKDEIKHNAKDTEIINRLTCPQPHFPPLRLMGAPPEAETSSPGGTP